MASHRLARRPPASKNVVQRFVSAALQSAYTAVFTQVFLLPFPSPMCAYIFRLPGFSPLQKQALLAVVLRDYHENKR